MPRKHLARGAVVAIAVALVVVLWPRKHGTEPPPVLGVVPDFQLTSQAGSAFASSRELRGRAWAASFIFTRCTTVCPLLTAKMKRVDEGTRALGDRLRLVSFTVDPDFDSPSVLADYARAQGADTSRWSFLTGDPALIAAALKIGFEKVPGKPPGESIIHGSHIVLVDRDMNIRGYYDSSDEGALRRLLDEAARLAR